MTDHAANQRGLEQEQALSDLDQSIADREQALADVDQAAIERDQATLDDERAQGDPADFVGTVGFAHRQSEVDRRQERSDARQDQVDQAQTGGDQRQTLLDGQQHDLEQPRPLALTEAQMQALGPDNIEFPRVHPARNGLPTRFTTLLARSGEREPEKT